MQHRRTRVRPERKKNVPPSSPCRTPAPPIDAMLVASRAELGTGFPVRKNRSCLVRGRYSEAANIAREGPVGHSQGMGWDNVEGTFFFARDGKGSHSEHAGIGIRANFACALEAWHCPRFVSLWKAGHHRTYGSYHTHIAESSRRLIVPLCLVWRLRFAMAPHLTSAELDFVCSLASQGKSPAEVHAALSRKRSRQGLQAPQGRLEDEHHPESTFYILALRG